MCSAECKCGTRAKPCQNKVRLYIIKIYRLFYIYNFMFFGERLHKFIVCLLFAQGTADKPERQQTAGSRNL